MKRSLVILFTFLVSLSCFAQWTPDDTQSWNWTRVEGQFDEQDVQILDKPLQYSMEVHYRLKNDMGDFHQMILRPMLGYKLDETSTLWLGYAYVGQDRAGNYVNEHRLFQMVTYSAKIGKSPVVFVGNTRFEQRQMENQDEINLRIRQMVRFSADLFKIKQGTFALFFQDEVFLRLNETQWSGQRGFDQNRLTLGLDFKTKLGNAPTTISVGYMYNTFPTQTTHGVNIGVRVTIPHNKKKR